MTKEKRPNLYLLLVMSVLAFSILCALGIWQLQRLEWKQGLIERIDTRVHQEPISLQQVASVWGETADVAYLPLTITGQFLHHQERYFYSLTFGKVGWEVFTPFDTGTGIILVNRGFILEHFQNPASRSEGQVEGVVTLTGLARESGFQGDFVPDNDEAGNVWYWRDLMSMSVSVGISEENILPFYLDLVSPAPPGGVPLPGVTRLQIPNKHFAYALTWFALAGVLIIIVAIFIRNGNRR